MESGYASFLYHKNYIALDMIIWSALLFTFIDFKIPAIL